MKNQLFRAKIILVVIILFMMKDDIKAQEQQRSRHQFSATLGARTLSLSGTAGINARWWGDGIVRSPDKAFGTLKGFTGGITYTYNMGRMNVGASVYGGYTGNTKRYKGFKNSMYFWERTFSAFAAYRAWESGPLSMDMGFSINQTATSKFDMELSTLGDENETFKIRGEGSYVDIFGKLTYQIHPRLAISARVSQVALNSAALMFVSTDESYHFGDLTKYPKNLMYRIETQFVIKK